MTTEHELSKLLSGELTEEQAANLRLRIAADPVLAAQWTAMAALPNALHSLPDTRAPVQLDKLVVRQRAAMVEKHSTGRWHFGWPALLRRFGSGTVLAAAAVGLFALGRLTYTDATVTLQMGSNRVEGYATLFAADTRVVVDGVAVVSVEPSRTSHRSATYQEEIMKGTHPITALAGSALTVVVLEGSALLYPEDTWSDPVEILAGETYRIRADETRSAPDRVAEVPFVSVEHDRVTELEGQVKTLQFENAIMKGQLATYRSDGRSEWPAEVPNYLKPEVPVSHPDLQQTSMAPRNQR
ncbi:MAG: hypothetical protein HN348_23485 [Proteobacteria bacterium]|nr:hypothetical protein [Pseudomonadota bacterium]